MGAISDDLTEVGVDGRPEHGRYDCNTSGRNKQHMMSHDMCRYASSIPGYGLHTLDLSGCHHVDLLYQVVDHGEGQDDGDEDWHRKHNHEDGSHNVQAERGILGNFCLRKICNGPYPSSRESLNSYQMSKDLSIDHLSDVHIYTCIPLGITFIQTCVFEVLVAFEDQD